MRSPFPLNTHTIVRIERLFQWKDRGKAKKLLLNWRLYGRDFDTPLEAERLRFAALRVSDGVLAKLEEAIDTGTKDYRDLLVEAGFASHHEQHQRWWPEDKVSIKSAVAR